MFNRCGCKTIPPQCVSLTCDTLHHQSYNESTGICICTFGTGILPVPSPSEIPRYLIGKASSVLKRDNPICPEVLCWPGSTLDPDTCACKQTWSPDSCPLIKCRGGYHPVYHAATGSCGCDLDCPGLVCPDFFNPWYNYSTKVCTCQKLDGGSSLVPTSTIVKQLPPAASSIVKQLPPTTDSVVKQAPPITTSISPPAYVTYSVVVPPEHTAPADTVCIGLYCISEMHPVFNNELGRCECVWIEGWGP